MKRAKAFFMLLKGKTVALTPTSGRRTAYRFVDGRLCYWNELQTQWDVSQSSFEGFKGEYHIIPCPGVGHFENNSGK